MLYRFASLPGLPVQACLSSAFSRFVFFVCVGRMQKVFPEEYNFIPRTWILPADYGLLQNHAKDMRAKKKMRTYIVKPANGAQGHG